MARWKPGARDRLAAAALDLFAERGYENTTVIDIAERAGLAKTTFFRHFQDKREVMFGGSGINDLIAAAIDAAPHTATPLEAVAHAVDAVGSEIFTPARRAWVAQRQSVIDANPELREREAVKNLSLVATMTDALARRAVPVLAGRLAAEIGTLVSGIAFGRWIESDNVDEFSAIARRTLEDVRNTMAVIG